MSQAMSGGMAMGGPGGPPPGAAPGSMGPTGMMGEQAPQEGAPSDVPTESDFEQSFFDISLVYLRDKAPMLMEHLLGFEILEHDEEDERAAGVFGFKLGEQELYAPVFFINGELKGYELLYIKGDDMFVPLQENWVNYLMNRRPHILGDTTEETDRSISRVQPDFRPFWDTPMRNKYASMLKPPRSTDDRLDMEKVAEEMPSYVTRILHEMKIHPRLAEGVFTYYPADRFEKVAAKFIGLQNGNRVSEKGRVTYQNVEILSGTDDKRTLIANNKDKERLAAGDVVIHDHRKGTNVSKYVPALEHHRVFTPSKTGLYEILMKGCKKKKMLVICHPVPIGRGHSRYIVLVDPETGASSNVFNDDVYAFEHHQRDWDKYFDSLPSQDNIRMGDRCILINCRGRGTVPFSVEEVIKHSDGATTLQVRTSQYLEPSQAHDVHLSTNKTTMDDQRYILADEQTAVGSRHKPNSDSSYFLSGADRVIQLNGCQGDNYMQVGTALVVPLGFKMIKLSPSHKHIKSLSSEPGTLVDLDMGLEGVAPRVKMHHDGSEFRLYTKDNDKPKPVLAKSAIIELIRVHGLNEEDARFIVKESQVKGQLRFRIKYAPGYPMEKTGANRLPILQQGTGIQMPAVPDDITQYNSTLGVMEHIPQVRTIPGTLPANVRQDRRISPLLDPYDIRTLSEAQSTGQKEVFDTAMLGSLLRSMQPIEMVDKYLSDLMRGLDRVGRILFLFYWHGDDFKSRYGTEELSELESSLKNVFKGIGDLVLFLKQRSVEEFNSRDEIDLSDVQ